MQDTRLSLVLSYRSYDIKGVIKMKKVILILLACLLATLASASMAQYFLQAAEKATEYTKTLTEDGYDYDSDCCFFGTYLEEGTTMQINYYFEEGEDYMIWAFGDDDMIDLDLNIEDAYGNDLMSDASVNDYAEVEFVPDESDIYALNVKNYSSNSDSFVMFGVMHFVADYPDDNPGDRCVEALDLTKGSIENLDNDVFILNQIFLVGGIMPSGSYTSYGSYALPFSATLHCLTQGSSNASDIDVKVTRQEDYETSTLEYSNDDAELMDADNAISNTARVSFDLEAETYYSLKYRNYRSDGRAFVFNLIYMD
jgi:hypothetical protein